MNPIPQFPAMRRLALADREAIEAIVGRFAPYSDFTFSSLWAWDTDESCAIAMLGENLVVRFKDYDSEDHFYSFIGQDTVVTAAETLLAHARAEGLPARLRLVPEEVVAADGQMQERFAVTPDRDNFDYVDSTADWADFARSGFREHRRSRNRCQERGTVDVRPFDPGDATCQDAIVDLCHRWSRQKSAGQVADHRSELTAVRRIFALADEGRLSATGFYDGKVLIGYTLWEGIPNSEWAVMHFQKADRSYRGLPSWQTHEMGRTLIAQGYRLVNGEQDMGIPGLRAYKESLLPCRYLKKYVVARRDGRQCS